MQSETMGFSNAVQAVAEEARRMDLVVPAFRSPPALAGVNRTIRRVDGASMVAVRVRGRPFADVVADVIDGVLVANGVSEAGEPAVRRRLLSAVESASPR